MLTDNRSALRLAAVVSFLAIALAVMVVPAHAVGSANVVISQVYGGGGNSGATYKNDFIELFNRGTSAVDLSTWSVQYASSAGTSWQKTNLTGTLPPGHYYLVQEAAGTTAGTYTQLPTPDATGTIAMSASSGKVALVASQTMLTGSCPTGLVDFVGFGSSANCFEGTGPTATLSNQTAALRNGSGCTDTDSNSVDFATGPATPRNSTSPANACPTSTDPAVTLTLVNPNNAQAGWVVTFVVGVQPGSNPTSTGIKVTLNVMPLGSPAVLGLNDEGINGDVVANDGNFTGRYLIPASASAGSYSLSVLVTDAEGRSATGSIALTITVPATYHPIHEIQGTGNTSPFNGQPVQTSGIVTAVVSNGFYLEAPDSEQDADPATSEGIFVFTNGAPTVAVGDAVQLTGTVQEYTRSGDVLSTTELTSPAITVNSHGNSLPTTADINPDPSGTIDQLERYEGMRVHVASPQVVGPTGGSTTSDGIFYVTTGTVPRPFREPGLEPGIAYPIGMPSNVPHFDGNPERIRVDASACRPAPAIGVGSAIPDITGPLGYAGDFTVIAPCPFAPLTQTAVAALPDRGDREFTVASFNMLNFTNDATRIAKASLAIRNVMRTPDIIGVEEMKDLATLQALAAKVNADAVAAGQSNPNYVGQLLGTSGTQNLGFLYRGDRVTDVTVVQVGADATFTDPRDGSLDPVNDRPPLVMTAKLLPPKGQPFPVTVIVNHLRSLIDVDAVSGTGDFVRYKRRAGAEYLADLIRQHQTAGENVISVGDYNAFEFNDGYVDVLGTVKGQPTPADQVLLSSSDLVDRDAVDLAMTLAANRRYSYVEYGNAQTLDHIVATAGLLARPFHLEVAHNNADFPKTLSTIATRPERVSDHDMPVAYFTFPPQADLATSITAADAVVLSGQLQSYTVVVENKGPDAADNVTVIDALPDHTGFESVSAPGGWECTAPGIGGTGQVSCTAASLASGDKATFNVVVRVNCATADGAALVSAAGVTSDTIDPQAANNNASVTTSVSNPAPVIAGFTADKFSLGPPNHKLIPITLSYAANDNCDTSILPYVSVSSNQPLNGTGDGNTVSDWQVVDAHHVLLRAERAPDSASGRTYTIKVTATDSMGYSSSQSLQINVPR